MIFKVYYQENIYEAPTRESTKVLFIKADSERDVRKKLADREYNIEFVKLIEDEYLEFEQQREDFKVLEI